MTIRRFADIINCGKKRKERARKYLATAEYSRNVFAMISRQRQNVFPDDNIRFTCKQNGTMKFSYSG